MSVLVVFCCLSSVLGPLQKASTSVQEEIWPTISISAQQQQQQACCPSAPRRHERFMFILERSVCLFRKGFDHSTPWPPGSNYPPAAVIRSTLSPGQFGTNLYFYGFHSLLNCSSHSFFRLSRLPRSRRLQHRPTVESFHCLMMVWVPG